MTEVVAPVKAVRNEKGQFLKGNPIRPVNPGRVKKAIAKELLEALAEVSTPETIAADLDDVVRIAKEERDAKTLLEVVRLKLAYLIGKPVQRSITASIDPDEFRALFTPEEEQEVIDGTIDTDI